MGGISLWPALLYMKTRSTDDCANRRSRSQECATKSGNLLHSKKLTTPFLLKVGSQLGIKTRLSLIEVILLVRTSGCFVSKLKTRHHILFIIFYPYTLTYIQITFGNKPRALTER